MNLDCYPADGTAGMSPPPRDMSPPAAPCHADVAGGSGDEDPLAYQTDPGRTGADEPRAKKRRKQSNPVRYHTSPVLLHEGPDDLAVTAATDLVGSPTDDEECAEDVPPSATSPAARSDDTVVDAGVLNLETSKRRRRDDFNGEHPEMASGPLRCHHCNAGFATDDQLRLHIEEEHVQKLLEKQLQQQASYNRAFAAAAAAAAAAAGDKNSGSTSSLDMQNPPPFLDRKPTVSETAEFAKNHPFPFPAMPPLIPISQSGNEVKPGSLPVPLGMFPEPNGAVPVSSASTAGTECVNAHSEREFSALGQHAHIQPRSLLRAVQQRILQQVLPQDSQSKQARYLLGRVPGQLPVRTGLLSAGTEWGTVHAIDAAGTHV
ncbi:hypothetical protein MRX96_005021 [Rhipicephalus microplus]